MTTPTASTAPANTRGNPMFVYSSYGSDFNDDSWSVISTPSLEPEIDVVANLYVDSWAKVGDGDGFTYPTEAPRARTASHTDPARIRLCEEFLRQAWSVSSETIRHGGDPGCPNR